MKLKLILIAAALITSATTGLMAWQGSPADQGEIKRTKADKIMSQIYGEHWMDLLVASETNRSQEKAMVAAYELAIGLHHSK
jgi:hypothetical protein